MLTAEKSHRVAIIGCPGSGKTTFARQLAEKSGLPLYHLDYYYYDASKDYPADKTAWRKQVTALVSKNRWIIDGNYKSTFDIRLPRADTIILLDFPRRVIIWRMLKRRVKYHKRLRPDMPIGWKEQISPQFLKFVWQYNRAIRPTVYETIEHYRPTTSVIIVRNQRQLNLLLQDRPH